MMIKNSLNNFNLNHYTFFTKKFSIEKDFHAFSELSKDNNLLHHDLDYARDTEFLKPIVPMHLSTLPFSQIAGMIFPGRPALYLHCDIQALKPIYYNIELYYSARIINKSESCSTLTVRTIIFKDKTVFLKGEQLIKVRDENLSNIFPIDQEKKTIFTIKPIALITGASGAVGKNIALSLAKKGYDLILHFYENKNAIAELSDKCRQHNVRTITVQADLTIKEEREKFSKLIQHHAITHFIHTVSTRVHSGIDNLLTSNYIALKELVHDLLPNMLKMQYGNIIFIGSTAIQSYPSDWEDYIAAKSAAVSFINNIHKNFRDLNITAFTFSPSLIESKFSNDIDNKTLFNLLPEQVAEKLVGLLEKNIANTYFTLDTYSLEGGTYGFTNENKFKQIEYHEENKSVFKDKDIEIEELNAFTRKFFNLDENFNLYSARFQDFNNWDSLKHLQFLIKLEKIFNFSFPSTVLDSMRNYNELINYIKKVA